MSAADFWVGPFARPDTYRLVELLGGGGEGEVWRAELPLSAEGRGIFAVKILPAHPGDDREWERTGRLLRTLHHPGLVRVIEVFTGPRRHRAGLADPESRAGYVIMDHIEGVTLREWCEENPGAPISERLRKLRTVASALDEMHSGEATNVPVAHGDVKPANIVARATGGAVLVDLGLTRLTDAAGVSGLSATYAAPELRRPEAMATPEADRYAFAVTTAQTLLGRQLPVGPDGWLDVGSLEHMLHTHPITARRPGLVRHVLSAITAPPEGRPRWLRQWLDGATDSLSQATDSGSGSGGSARSDTRNSEIGGRTRPDLRPPDRPHDRAHSRQPAAPAPPPEFRPLRYGPPAPQARPGPAATPQHSHPLSGPRHGGARPSPVPQFAGHSSGSPQGTRQGHPPSPVPTGSHLPYQPWPPAPPVWPDLEFQARSSHTPARPAPFLGPALYPTDWELGGMLPAAPWRRFAARLIDAAFFYGLCFVVICPMVIITLPLAFLMSDDHISIIGISLVFAISLVGAETLLLVRLHGQTPGKALLGLGVILNNRPTNAIPARNATIRMLVLAALTYTPALLITIPLNALIVTQNRRHRSLHDYLAGTRVVQAPRRPLSREDLVGAISWSWRGAASRLARLTRRRASDQRRV